MISSDSTTLNSSSVGKILNTTNSNNPVTVSTATPYAANSSLTVTTTWANLCASVSGGSASCDKSFSNTFNIGYNDGSSTLTEYIAVQINFRYVVGANTAYQSFNCSAPVTGEGFCFFTLYPGDQKAYIVPTFNPNNSTGVVADYTTASSGAADVSGIKYKYLRVMYLQGTGPSDTQNAGTHPAEFVQSLSTAVNLPITELTASKVSVSPNKITGLTNQSKTTGNAYLFYTASVDQAGIVTNYSDPQYLCVADATYCPNCTTADHYETANTQCVLPQKVNGLLDGQECFIATASYGSIMAPEVETFRRFRGEYLLKSDFGKTFVRTYYKYSPPMAEVDRAK